MAPKDSLWFFTCVLIFSRVSLEFSSASPQTEEKLSGRVVKGPLRSRRQACEYGTYTHENRTCCRCGPGLKLKSHCPANQKNGQCESCDNGTYSSHATSQDFCEPCTSCVQPNANLEEVEPCTLASNAKCRCKKHYYCSSETCTACFPCKQCGSEGVACTAENKRVCNAMIEAMNGGTIAGIVCGILAICAVSIGVLWYCRRRQFCSTYQPSPHRDVIPTDDDLQPLNDLETQHVPDIAAALGWKDMQDVAMRSGMTEVEIDSCKQVNPTDPDEQTVQLLLKWMQKEGRGGSNKLIRHLQNGSKKKKAEQVEKILGRDSTAPV